MYTGFVSMAVYKCYKKDKVQSFADHGLYHLDKKYYNNKKQTVSYWRNIYESAQD